MTPAVKICGVRRREDAILAAELGASAIGFVFWPGSPRFVDPYRARAIVRSLPPWVSAVGVFVDQPADHVAAVARLAGLGAVQLHGAERPADFARGALRIIKAVAVTEDFSAASLAALPADVTVLLDAHDPVRRGGTGRTIAWPAAAAVARIRPVMLAGGLNPGNVRDAIAQVRPAAIDVSSGVESAPGVKNHGRLVELFSAIRASAD
jgi:phosphoribosylanthranilate isomerase